MSTEPSTDPLDRPFVFRDRPAATSAGSRPIWRIPIVVLLVRACRQQRATHRQLHVLNWALRSTTGAQQLNSFLGGKIDANSAIVRFDPSLDRAVALAHGLGYLSWDRPAWKLSPSGQELARELDDSDILERERGLLAGLPKPLTQSAVDRLLKREQQ